MIKESEETELSREAAKVINWRQQWLHAAGYSKTNCELIATSADIDLHFACNLLKNGCTQEQAMEILF